MWTGERDGKLAVLVQNGSSVALTFVFLMWENPVNTEPKIQITAVVEQKLEPCTRWTLGLDHPKFAPVRELFLDGVAFIDANGAWKVDSLLGELEGPHYGPPKPDQVLIVPWESSYMTAEAIEGCSVSG
ncbi:hypothetical protein Ato02nite_056020 [Paractinoplanes toevensis]|uniref:Uncharacterized protein n=1 Tax=Paractinoplanes toevensis TaxID=571911 RepID=A0A919TGR3_9ACTN|nr:hypothetical protein Ato02nite_056020 [Actinoplanes toevensis]